MGLGLDEAIKQSCDVAYGATEVILNGFCGCFLFQISLTH